MFSYEERLKAVKPLLKYDMSYSTVIREWCIGTSPGAELVNTMLDEAILSSNENEKPIIHSDRGCHYRWPGWIERIEKAELIRSMSKKGCSLDNAACEVFLTD